MSAVLRIFNSITYSYYRWRDRRWTVRKCHEQLRCLREGRNHRDRVSAAEFLGRQGYQKAVSVLCECLTAQDAELRNAAVTALGRIGDRRAAEPLTELLSHPDEDVRLATAHSLAALHDDRCVPELLLATEHGFIRKRIDALEALSSFSSQEVDKARRAHLSDSAWEVRLHAIENLAKAAPSDVHDRKTVMDSLYEIALHDEVFAVQKTAIVALRELGDSRYLDFVEGNHFRDSYRCKHPDMGIDRFANRRYCQYCGYSDTWSSGGSVF